MKPSTKAYIVFWLHFLIAILSHVSVVLIFGGLIKLISLTVIGFWEKGLLFGITFYTAMFAINHITNQDGFCALTDLENYYRKHALMPKVGPFTPRFYAKCRAILAALFYKFKKRK